MLQAFLSLMAVAERYGLRTPELADNSWRECAQQLSPDRRVYGEVERRVQVRANARLVLQTASPHCQHSPLESFQSFDRTACGYDRRRALRPGMVQRAAGGGLQRSTG